MQRETVKALLSKIESAASSPTGLESGGAFGGQHDLGEQRATPDAVEELLVFGGRQ